MLVANERDKEQHHVSVATAEEGKKYADTTDGALSSPDEEKFDEARKKAKTFLESSKLHMQRAWNPSDAAEIKEATSIQKEAKSILKSSELKMQPTWLAADASAISQMLGFSVHGDRLSETAADKQAEKAAVRQARQLGQRPDNLNKILTSPRDRCRSPSIWDEQNNKCLQDPRQKSRPRGLNAREAAAWETERNAAIRRYVGQVHKRQVKKKIENARRPDFKYEGMTAQAAQVYLRFLRVNFFSHFTF